MKITADIPNHGLVLEAILEGFAQAAQMMVEAGVVPPFPHMAGVKYRREPGETWLLPNQVLEKKQGDCEDLCFWAVGGYRATGQDPGARCALRMTGAREVHCIVQLSNGQTVDPSLQLMMMEQQTAVSGFDDDFVLSLGDVIVRDHRGEGKRAKGQGVNPPAQASSTTTPGALTQIYDRVLNKQNPTGYAEGFDDVVTAARPALAYRPGDKRSNATRSTDNRNAVFNDYTGGYERQRPGQMPIDPYTGMPIGRDPVTGLPYGQYPYPYQYPTQYPYGYQPYPYPYQPSAYQYPSYEQMLYTQYPSQSDTINWGEALAWPTYNDIYGANADVEALGLDDMDVGPDQVEDDVEVIQ